MHKLIFGEEMEKMPANFQFSKLLQIFNSKYEDLTPDFVRYDTKFKWRKGRFAIPKEGECCILVLAADSGNGALWTTVRNKSDEYKKMEQSIVQIHIPPAPIEESFGVERLPPRDQIDERGLEG